LMHEGQAGTEVMVIRSGRVKVRYVAIDGREIVLDFRGPGELLGELAAIDGKPRSSSVEAMEPVEVLAVTAASFETLVAQRPGMSEALLHDLVRRFRDADLKRIEFGASPSIDRVAARLIEMVERFGSHTSAGHVIELPITQDELAGWTGSSREAVAKALRSLRELGLITTERRRITVLDLEGLEHHRH
jgi:CRP/FNR family transcriptional regulator, cyclic AMP receptor protein